MHEFTYGCEHIHDYRSLLRNLSIFLGFVKSSENSSLSKAVCLVLDSLFIYFLSFKSFKHFIVETFFLKSLFLRMGCWKQQEFLIKDLLILTCWYLCKTSYLKRFKYHSSSRWRETFLLCIVILLKNDVVANKSGLLLVHP